MFTLIQNDPVQQRPFTARVMTWVRQFASLPEPDELDYPFAHSDVARLQQFIGEPELIDGRPGMKCCCHPIRRN